jgi:hypothetical protein
VYDLSGLKNAGGNAHSRAFDDISDVMELVRQRNMQERGPQVARGQPPAAPPPQRTEASLRD